MGLVTYGQGNVTHDNIKSNQATLTYEICGSGFNMKKTIRPGNTPEYLLT